VLLAVILRRWARRVILFDAVVQEGLAELFVLDAEKAVPLGCRRWVDGVQFTLVTRFHDESAARPPHSIWRRAFRGGMLLEYVPERHFEAGAGTKAI
jgi:hypothetical protein